jgi:hypothetical protein
MGDTGEKKASRSMINAIEDKHPRTPLRANEGRKHNSNAAKDRGDKIKRLALQDRSPGRRPGVRMRLGKINTEARNTSMPLTYRSRGNAPNSRYGGL